jgi:2-methylisocitrate lyase-like PEP mutase family enzyme
MHHCRNITEATTLPVSADLEKGTGDSPDSAAETIKLQLMPDLRAVPWRITQADQKIPFLI